MGIGRSLARCARRTDECVRPYMFLSVRREGARFDAQQMPVHDVIERGAQTPVIVIFNSHEAECLQHAFGCGSHRTQDFGHAVHWSGLRLKCDFDEVALCQRLRQAQQSAGGGYGLKFSFGAAAIFKTNRSQDGISKLDPGRAPRGVRLGEVGHKLHCTIALSPVA
jgi:hypothetical protein